MTGADAVWLAWVAQRAARGALSDRDASARMTPPIPWHDRYLSVMTGESRAYSNEPLPGALLSAPLTPKNVASEKALARALLASAIHYHTDRYRDGEDTIDEEYAILGFSQEVADSRKAARDALLDTLLACAEAR